MKNIHICSLGWSHEPILEPILGGGLPCDKLYLLWNDKKEINETLDAVKEKISNANDKIAIEKKEVDPLDFLSVIIAVKEISDKEGSEETKLYINISLGTRIITGALSEVSCLVGAQRYYYVARDLRGPNASPEDCVIQINNTKIPEIEKIKGVQRKIIKYLETEKDPVSNGAIIDHLMPSHKKSRKEHAATVAYNLRVLEKDGLIKMTENEKDRRKKDVVLTDIGKMVASFC